MLHPFPEQTLHSLPDETAPDTSCEPSDRMPRFAPDEMPPFQPLATLAVNPLLSIEHTASHRDCPACTAADLELHGTDVAAKDLPFPEAAARWMALRRRSFTLKPRTHETNQGYVHALEKFFSGMRLVDITPGNIRSYQFARLHNAVRVQGIVIHPWANPAGHSCINHEICVVAQILRHCGLWHPIEPFYFPLPTKSWSPRTILTEADEEQLFEIAAKHPEAHLAYCIAIITNNTTASGLELRGLRLKHVLLPPNEIAEIDIPEDSVKNNSRPRKIALNPTARWAVEECLKRALRLGSCEPDHFLFPIRVRRGVWDPTRPATASWLRSSWKKLQCATGFHQLKPHDLRHLCITRLLENDVNPETVIAIAGHVSRKMLEYYSHQRKRVKYAAVMAIEPRRRA